MISFNKKNDKRTRNLYFIVISVLLISYDSYWFGTSGINLLELFRNLFVVTLPIVIYIKHPNTKLSKKNTIILFILLSIVSISSIFNGNSISAPLLIFSGIFIGLYLITVYSFYEFVKCYSNVVIVISVFSILVWIGCNFGIIPLHQTANIADSPVYTAYGCVFFSVLGDSILRNSSFFREPGVYMIILNFAIIFELFVIKSNRMWLKTFVLIISMITLLSTGGFICLGVTLIAYMIRSGQGILKLVVIAGILITLIVPNINEEYLDLIFFSKFNEMETSGSGFARMSSFFVPLEIFFDYPLIGCGYKQFEFEYVKKAFELYHRYVDPHGMSSNTVMNIFAIWGVIMGLFIVYGFYKLSSLITYKDSKIVLLLILLDLFMMFSNESMPYWPFLYIFIWYGVSYKNPREIKISNHEQKYPYYIARISSR